MKKRNITKGEKLKNIHCYFLACEFKPYSVLWSVLDPFAYDIEPAYIWGKLGVIGYEPESYSIVTASGNEEPLMGYVFTITHPETALLLDKIKGYHGKDALNFHNKQLTHAYVDGGKVVNAWCYVTSDYVLEAYKEIEEVTYGMWSEDENQLELLEKIINIQ